MDGATGTGPAWADRARGSLVLSACGDALGAPFEGDTRVDTGRLDRWLDDLQRVAALTRHGTSPPQVAAQLGNDVTALGSVPAALAAFLTHPGNARAAIRFAIQVGGDTDTIAAMTGALSGAWLGAPALPPHWPRRLEAADRANTLATDLAHLPTPADGDPDRQVPFPDQIR